MAEGGELAELVGFLGDAKVRPPAPAPFPFSVRWRAAVVRGGGRGLTRGGWGGGSRRPGRRRCGRRR